jgi:hypothetical protein
VESLGGDEEVLEDACGKWDEAGKMWLAKCDGEFGIPCFACLSLEDHGFYMLFYLTELLTSRCI